VNVFRKRVLKIEEVSYLLPVMSEIRLPTSEMDSSADRLNWPKVSIETGWNVEELDRPLYLRFYFPPELLISGYMV